MHLLSQPSLFQKHLHRLGCGYPVCHGAFEAEESVAPAHSSRFLLPEEASSLLVDVLAADIMPDVPQGGHSTTVGILKSCKCVHAEQTLHCLAIHFACRASVINTHLIQSRDSIVAM